MKRNSSIQKGIDGTLLKTKKQDLISLGKKYKKWA